MSYKSTFLTRSRSRYSRNLEYDMREDATVSLSAAMASFCIPCNAPKVVVAPRASFLMKSLLPWLVTPSLLLLLRLLAPLLACTRTESLAVLLLREGLAWAAAAFLVAMLITDCAMLALVYASARFRPLPCFVDLDFDLVGEDSGE